LGFYVNPAKTSKEDWLATNGTRLSCAPSAKELETMLAGSYMPVCYVLNVGFSAAAVCYSSGELLRFTHPDNRPKYWFKVPAAKLVEINALPENWQELLRE
jgi:hypothetical protein